jgi:hypothetical protein
MEVSIHFHGPVALLNGKAPRFPLDWRVNGPHSWSGCFRGHTTPFLLVGIELKFHGLSARSPVTVQNELPCKKMGISRLNYTYHRKSNPYALHPFFERVLQISVYQSSLHLILCLRASTLYTGDTRFVIISQFYSSYRCQMFSIRFIEYFPSSRNCHFHHFTCHRDWHQALKWGTKYLDRSSNRYEQQNAPLIAVKVMSNCTYSVNISQIKIFYCLFRHF